jgi:hypothetical protein
MAVDTDAYIRLGEAEILTVFFSWMNPVIELNTPIVLSKTPIFLFFRKLVVQLQIVFRNKLMFHKTACFKIKRLQFLYICIAFLALS